MDTKEPVSEESRNLRSRVAQLESKIDMLEAELGYLNEMLVRCGFPEGILTLKSTVEELLSEEVIEWEQRQGNDA